MAQKVALNSAIRLSTIGKWHMTKLGHSTIINFLGAIPGNIDYCTPNHLLIKAFLCRFNTTQMRWNLSSVTVRIRSSPMALNREMALTVASILHALERKSLSNFLTNVAYFRLNYHKTGSKLAQVLSNISGRYSNLYRQSGYPKGYKWCLYNITPGPRLLGISKRDGETFHSGTVLDSSSSTDTWQYHRGLSC
ncbi:hypothetical protein FF38_04224 [Lucilia cuprina]|uniref:Uncharacterized protein n=1 Tax=Lucilia cuprina TaxID=7375 RepID=A0A0L0BLS2_LUCCU|nr:hypothetical protein FF38_04224 [Lucilia cuprina]